jgi:hypothetical protein
MQEHETTRPQPSLKNISLRTETIARRRKCQSMNKKT